MIERQRLSLEDANNIIENYQLWQKKLSEGDLSTARWLCHGHIGLKVIWESFMLFIQINTLDNKKNSALGNIKKHLRLNYFMSAWTKRIFNEHYHSPLKVLSLVGIKIT
ncbi:hypothetical protein [Nodosilinea sp. P-1105]|uniref:hypothetical protein n=1 Tax=Nodosilinea sp. P-1105 TaxID=2546229 RepID=UPI00146BC0FF|nr:hypothetical protein [Nodosilinea sp. P-1105]NMF86472.1 hypothetical protein [Nodosilinea sp. P-1105]